MHLHLVLAGRPVRRENIAFVLGHALYMKAIHGGRAKNEKIDAHKIAVLLRGGMLPMAYVYPPEMRASRNLLRRRMHLMRKRSELLVHIQNTNSQYNLPEIGKNIAYKKNREAVAERFDEPSVRKSMEMNLSLIDHYDKLLTEVELYITKTAKVDNVDAFLGCTRSPASVRSWPYSTSTRSTKSSAFPQPRTLSPMPGWSSALKSRQENDTEHRAKRSAMCTLSGPSPKPRCFFSEPTRPDKNTWID
jgi:hypothetical protein